VIGVVGILAIVGVLGYALLRGQQKSAPQDPVLMNLLVETKLDLVRRDLEDKNYKRAIEQSAQILSLSPNNPEALGIREQAQSAIREIETSVAAAREAVARGDSAQASAALERVMARDPKNPVVAELSSQLNANFSARASAAKTEMDKAKTLAQEKEGAALDPAFAEGEKFATDAAKTLTDRQFTAATQTFLQARDAYDRARRAVELKEREAARATRATPTPGQVAVVVAPPAATPIPTAVLRPIPAETVAPLPPAPPVSTPVVVQTPVGPPPVTGPLPENREFITARTRVAAAPDAKKVGAGAFDAVLVDFSGRFEFEVGPSPLVPGGPFRVRVFLRNDGKKDARLDTLTVKTLRNGEVSSPPARILENDIKMGQRPLVAEIQGTWPAGTNVWVMDVEAMSKRGERFRSSLTMKQP
jgi:hypothetical protein